MKLEQMQDVEQSLRDAGKALRHAWKVMNQGGMEAAAKEIADTVLDVETATEQMEMHLLSHKKTNK